MLCDIYASEKKAEMYLYVRRGQDLEQLPAPLLALFGKARYVTLLNLTAERKLARADVTKVPSEIDSNHFYLPMPPSRYGELDPHWSGRELDGPAS